MAEETPKTFHPADTNGDGRVTDEEHRMYLEFKRKELEDNDAQRDAIRKMAWFSLVGLLLYPLGIFVTSLLDEVKTLSDVSITDDFSASITSLFKILITFLLVSS